MNGPVRERLVAAAREYFAAAPWERIGDTDLFGIRDEESVLEACASVLGSGGLEFGLAMCLGPEGFSVLDRVRKEGPRREDFLYEADVLSLSSLQRGEERVPASMRLGTSGALRLWAFRKPRAMEMRPPNDREAGFLARAASAVARRSSEGRLGEWPRGKGKGLFPFLVLPAAGEAVWTQGPRTLTPAGPKPRLGVPEDLRRAILSRPRAGIWLVSLLSPPASVGKEMVRLLLVYDSRADQVLHAEPFMGERLLEEAGAALLRFLASGPAAGPPSPRPREIRTDSAVLDGFAQEALSSLGIRCVLQRELPELEPVRESFVEFLARGGR